MPWNFPYRFCDFREKMMTLGNSCSQKILISQNISLFYHKRNFDILNRNLQNFRTSPFFPNPFFRTENLGQLSNGWESDWGKNGEPFNLISIFIGLISSHLFSWQKTSNGHSWKDNLIGDFYDDWSIEETCDTVTLESSHPLRPPNTITVQTIFYTHECKDDKIAYFKVDVNLIGSLPSAYLGNICEMYESNSIPSCVNIGRIQTLLRESVKFLTFGKILWSRDSPLKVGPHI